MNQIQKSRIEYLDQAKGLGILLMILTHCGFDSVNFYVCEFNMPLFFIISGYFYSPIKYNFVSYVNKTFHRILKPYLITCTVLLIGAMGGAIMNPSSFFSAILSFVFKNVFGTTAVIWFLLALFVSNIYLYFVVKYRCWIFSIILSLLVYMLYKYLNLPESSIVDGIVCSPYLLCGYAFRKYDLFERKYSKASCVPLLLVCMCFFIFSEGGLGLISLTFPNGIVIDFFISIVLTYLIVIFFRMAYKNVLTKCLGYLGMNTLSILIIHCFQIAILKFVKIPLFYENRYLKYIVLSLTAVLLSAFWNEYLKHKVTALRLKKIKI